MTQKFCSILVNWGKIQQLLPRSWRQWTSLNHEMLSLSDIFWEPLTKITFMAGNLVSKSTVSDLPHLAWTSRLFWSKWNFFNHLVTVLYGFFHWLFTDCSLTVWYLCWTVNTPWQTRGQTAPGFRCASWNIDLFCLLSITLDLDVQFKLQSGIHTWTQIWVQDQQDSSGPHCTKWVNHQQSPAGLEPRLVPNLPLP